MAIDNIVVISERCVYEFCCVPKPMVTAGLGHYWQVAVNPEVNCSANLNCCLLKDERHTCGTGQECGPKV